MSIRTVQHDESLAAVRGELVYSIARLKADPDAKDLASALSPLLARVADVAAGQLAAWDAEEEARAAIDAADDGLDDGVDEVDRALLHAERGDRTARHRRYFARPRNELVRLGVESELARLAEWPASLATEPEGELKQAGEALARALEAGKGAVRARSGSAAATADQRVRQIVPFIDDVNAARLSLYGALVQRGTAKKLPPDWANRFFKRTHRASRTAPRGG